MRAISKKKIKRKAETTTKNISVLERSYEPLMQNFDYTGFLISAKYRDT